MPRICSLHLEEVYTMGWPYRGPATFPVCAQGHVSQQIEPVTDGIALPTTSLAIPVARIATPVWKTCWAAWLMRDRAIATSRSLEWQYRRFPPSRRARSREQMTNLFDYLEVLKADQPYFDEMRKTLPLQYKRQCEAMGIPSTNRSATIWYTSR